MFQLFLRKINNIMGSYTNEVFYSLIGFVIFLVILTSIRFFINKQEWHTEKKHKHYVSARNLLFFCFLISLVSIWAGEIKTFLFSAAAIFAALMIVFKELLLSFIGGILINNQFNVGDYISYDGVEGRIIDRNFFNTKVLVSSPFQNKELVFPNMHYVTNKITNLSRYGAYQVFHLDFGFQKLEDIEPASTQVLIFAQQALEPYKQSFIDYFEEREKEKIFFDSPNIDPKITFDLSDPKKLFFTLYFMAPRNKKEIIEREIIHKFITFSKTLTKTETKEDKD